jgi:glyoxylase-like metal-dependent hydrolase (beta-lactamase superfamily II)
MNTKTYSFTVGQVECMVLLDGASLLGTDRFLRRYPDASEAEYRQAYADIGLSFDLADTSFNILLAKIGAETVLIDAGEGGRPNGGQLLESMRLVNVAPEAITLVVITHAHGDHVLGLLTDDRQPVFPHATYVLSKPEMVFWQSRIADGASDQRAIVDMMQQQGLRLIEMDEQIIPGMRAVPIPGHTPGHIAVVIESEQEQLIHMADLLHVPIQFAHPEWSPTFDADTSLSVPTRQAALERVANHKMLVLFYHLTFPGLGWVTRATKDFAWEPLKP